MGTATPQGRLSGEAPDHLVARDDEIRAVEALLADGAGRRQALVLEGEPGIGKTSVWELGVAQARERGARVLPARASGAEAGLPNAGLIDLLDDVTADELAGLPPPQLRALEVALYRREPDGPPPEPGAVALGLLTTLRDLAARGPVLLAVDDLQWLDRASEEALAYAARRLDGADVRFLLARRPGGRSAVEAAFAGDRVERVAVGPISLGATRQVLAARLGVRLPHHLLRRVYDTTLGNPLFVLEVGRMLAGRDLGSLGEDVPVPDDVDDLLGLRVADLESPERRVLLALALAGDLRAAQLERLAGAATVASAVADGVAVVDGDRVRPSHPLLAAAAERESADAERRDLHRALAGVVPDEPRRALHLALATPDTSPELADRVAAAAGDAAARAATRLAVRLGTHALRLTPPGSPAEVDRVLALAEQLAVAGEKQRLTDLLADRAATLPTPAARTRAHLLLAAGVVRDNDDIRGLLERALAEAGDDRLLRGQVLAELAVNEAVITVVAVARADRRAEEAVACCGPDHPAEHSSALHALAWTRALGGRPVADLVARYAALADDQGRGARDPGRVAAQRLVWRGEVAAAREQLTALQARAEDLAEPASYALARLHRCELELRIGAWDAAERLLDEWGASTDSWLLHWPMYERCRALLAAGRGDAAATRHLAAEALDRAAVTGVRWDWLEATRALGLAALLDKDPEAAVRQLSAVWDHTEREGVADPGAFPAAPDLVEALLETGDRAGAQRVTARLASLAEEQDHPWASVGARRSAALVALDDGYDDAPADALARAAAAYDDLGLGFDAARTLLALGRAQRRARKWGAAREALERAVAAFTTMGSPGWADDARSEVTRVGARRPSSGRLTDTERRVAELAVEGLTNKEIARALVVTVSTVEFHLRNAYGKLGIRSRVQLAGGVLDDEEPPD